MIIRQDTTKRCRRHQIRVASQFIGWSYGRKGIACRRYATRPCYRVPKGTPFLFPMDYQPMNWLAARACSLDTSSARPLVASILRRTPIKPRCGFALQDATGEARRAGKITAGGVTPGSMASSYTSAEGAAEWGLSPRRGWCTIGLLAGVSPLPVVLPALRASLADGGNRYHVHNNQISNK